MTYLYCIVTIDTVASTVDSTKNTAQSTIETGKSYVDSAKGKSIIKIRVNIFVAIIRRFLVNHRDVINIIDTIQNTIQSSVDTTKTVAHSAVETGKTYVNTAKGKPIYLLKK